MMMGLDLFPSPTQRLLEIWSELNPQSIFFWTSVCLIKFIQQVEPNKIKSVSETGAFCRNKSVFDLHGNQVWSKVSEEETQDNSKEIQTC